MKSQLRTYGAEICRVELLPHNRDLRLEDQKPQGLVGEGESNPYKSNPSN